MSACFHCRNSIGEIKPPDGWVYTCTKGQTILPDGDDPIAVERCPEGAPRYGFQIGGYWTHMWFEKKSPQAHCLEWKICSDGEFPTKDRQPGMEFHICDFRQMEKFVAYWGKIFRERGWIRE